VTDLPALSASPAPRPTPSTAARAPEASGNTKQALEDGSQFHEELAREINAQQSQPTPAKEARANAALAEKGKSKDGTEKSEETTKPADSGDESLAEGLKVTSAEPATLINVIALPAAAETLRTDEAASTGLSAVLGRSGNNARGPHSKWPGETGTDPMHPDAMSALADANAAGMESMSSKSRAELGLAASAALAESAAAGKFVLAGRDRLDPAAALESSLAQTRAAETPLSASMNAGTTAGSQGTHSTTATATIAAHVAAAGWDRGLGEKVLWMAGQQLQVAQLHLNPPELGPLQITLTLSNDQASAQFVSQHALVREAIEAAMPRLREMLAEGGITLGNASVSADSFREQAQGQQDSRNQGSRGVTQAETSGAFRLTQSLRATHGLVDIFA
jgi:hypothetical protein